MRKGWEYKKLGEICSSDLGKTLNKSKDVGNMHPYLCAINILWDSIDLTTLKEACFKDDEIDRYTVKYGDLLVCEGGDTGRAAIWDRKEPILYQNALHRLRFKEDVDARFIMYNLWHKKQIGEIDHKYSKGVTILHLVKSALLSIPILLPPLSTQLAIVSELDKINELIHLKKEQLKDFDNLAQSLFYEMFGDPVENEKGWEVKKLGEIGEVKTGNTPSRSNDSFYNEKFIEWIKTDNIRNEQMNPTTAAEYLSKEGAECGRIVGKGSILVACIAGSLSSIGKCCITTKNVAFNQQINAITPYGDFCNSIYLYELIRNSSKYIQQNATTGMKHILSKSIFEKLKFPLPPLPLQRLFAQRIEQIEREKSEVQKSIQDLETLLASRMQYWFE